MADQSVQKLRDAFADAPTGKVVLNDAFWTGAGLVPPADFTANIKAAYRLPASAAGLEIEYDRGNVSPVVDDQFQVTDVALTFLNAQPAKTSATIYGKSGAATPVLGIDVVPADWQLAQFFTSMNTQNWPFVLLQVAQQRFFFTTAPQLFTWAAQGATLDLAAGQNLYGVMTVNALVQPLFPLITNLPPVPTTIVLCGAIVLDKANNDTILYPDMNVRAPITGGQDLKLFFIDVVAPHVGFMVTTAMDVEDEDGARLLDEQGDPTEVPAQTPYYYFGTDLTVNGVDTKLPLKLQATVSTDVSDYQFSITEGDDKTPITPAAVLKLVAGQSYFQYVPAVLQQYLASVRMQGLTLDGPLQPSIGLDSVSVQLGSVQQNPIPLFTDPTTSQAFQLDSFSLVFTVASPLTPAQAEMYARFEAAFKLFPEVFRTKDGTPGGLFVISIDTNLNFEGVFQGKVSFDDVLRTITGGAIGMPQGVVIEFSDIFLRVNSSEKSYSLGFQVDAQVDIPFVEYTNAAGDKTPLIQVIGLAFELGASTPNSTESQKGKTVYTGSIDGQIAVGPAIANVMIAYDGTLDTPLWQLEASLAEPLVLSELINQFFRAYDLPEFLPGTLTIEELAVSAKIPVASSNAAPRALRLAATRPARHVGGAHLPHGWRSPVRPVSEIVIPRALRATVAAPPPADKSSYLVSTKIRWVFDLTDTIKVDILADLGLNYDGNRPTAQQFAGWAIGTFTIDAVGMTVEIGYRFGPAEADKFSLRLPMTEEMRAAVATGDSSVLWIAWKGFRAEYSFTDKTVTFSLSGWSVGSLITALVDMLGDPYFTLPAPWNLLNQISLNGLSVAVDLKTGVTNRIKAKYSLPSPIDLGFITIKGIVFQQVDGKVTLAIDGSSTFGGLQGSPLLNPNGNGQDVKSMPPIPGRGNQYFDLKLLALGQRVAIYDPGAFNSTQAVIKALEKIPPSSGSGMPFDPTQRVQGQPYYDSASNWLGALHFGLFKIPATNNYSIDLMVVFNDPNLYGLRVALNGDKVKVLSGLAIDVLYKKITDDIGCYQIEFTLPSVLRNLDFGAFSVTLPVIGLQIYTNGDFLVDFGFPYNMDFSRSFTVSAIILGVPVLGSGGFYFGKLSNATAPNLPKTTLGTFDPVIVFGLGAQLGVGRYVDKGILKAGFSITVFGIIEGTLAAWHPYPNARPSPPAAVQGDYYFKISGTFGIIGKLYGSIDFAIIKADVSLVVTVYARIVYESFRQIPLTLSASVQVSVTIKIDLGLFSISISLSFSASITETLTIGSNSQAPWDANPPPMARTLRGLGITAVPLRLDFARPRRALAAAATQALEVTALTQFTVLAREGVGYAAQEGGFVLLFAMDAPVAGGSDDGGNTSFGKLCGALLPWIIDSVHVQPDPRWPVVAPGAVSRPLLEAILQVLSDPAQAPFTATQVVDFIKANFTVTVSKADASLSEARKKALDAGSTIFPAFGFLSLTVPNPNADSGDVTIAFDNYVTSTTDYQDAIRTLFNTIAANVAAEQRSSSPRAAPAVANEPIASTVFVDYFILLARQLVQSAIDSFDDYPYPLTGSTTIQSILDWANGLFAGQLTADALLSANLVHPLAPNKLIEIGPSLDHPIEGFPVVQYMVQTGDTLTSIAARYANPANPPAQTTPATLILANAAQNNLLQPGITITIAASSKTYVTAIGDDFNKVAHQLDVDIVVLSQQTSLYTLANLLAPAVVTTIPNVTVTTTGADTLQGLLDRFRVPLGILETPANLALAGLFLVDPTLRFAVPGLIALPEAWLWPAILATRTLGQTAGTAARYMMHGMRLPVAPGLALPATGFLYGAPHWTTTQSGYGVYQLIGQQFPLATRSGGYSITLARPNTQDFNWITIGTGSSVAIDIAAQAKLLSDVLGSAQKNGYKPTATLAAAPEVNVGPRHYGMASVTPWDTSDVANILAITRPATARGFALMDAAAGPQGKPLLWALSSGLLRAIEQQQAALATRIPTVAALSPYLPILAPSVGTTDPATGETTYVAVQDFALATRVDFRIKRLAQDVDLAPPRPDANSVVPPGPGNSGTPARPLAPFAYEIIGPNPADAILLERLLTAMASEGERIISEIFLLYADIDNGTKGLTSRASSEFLSFIVQSNLSTETNPPQALLAALKAEGAALPTGIANTPAEFIKLLWELSTVNSGGTWLFYQLLDAGLGLPTALFDDSGIATLTLVAAIARDPAGSTGARMTNAVNALITMDPIDPQRAVVRLTGVSDPIESLTLDPNATLADVAAFYGVDIGAIVAANAGTAVLKTGRPVPIAGLYRELLPADVGVGKDPLQALADYYSVGVSPAITKQQIIDLNPGVPVEALALFRIPPFTYSVQTGGPGNTFASMARYYAADLSLLAYQARVVPGLFQGPKIDIDPVSLDAQPNLGLGNAGIAVERERGATPQPPPAMPIDDYTQATMLQLYQLLSAGIMPNAFFNVSADSAAFGPKDPPPPAPSVRRVRRLTPRLAVPAADQNYLYDQALGFTKGTLAKVNAARSQPNLPSAADSPYKGIGSIMQFRLAWQDLFGNRTPNPFSLPQATDPPPFGGLPAAILYPDRLLPLDQWPSTTRAYRYTGNAGAPVLEIDLKLDTTPYQPSTEANRAHLNAVRDLDTIPVWQRNAINDLAKFTLVYFQLNQDYTPLDIPGLSGPAVTMSLRNTLLQTQEAPLPVAARDLILGYVNAAILYLQKRADGITAPDPAPTLISLPIDLATVAQTRDIIRLELELRFTRQALLVTPGLRALTDGLTVGSAIPVDGELPAPPPNAEDDPPPPKYPVALTLFAALFETAFVAPNWRMRIGTSSADPSAPNNARAYTVWAVRMAELAGAAPQGIGFRIGNAPRYYAPWPIASALKTLTVAINRYVTGAPYPDGTPIPTTFTNVDPNTWLAECLTAIDDFLSASYSTPTFLLDRLLGLNEKAPPTATRTPADDPKTGYLTRMLEHKRTLAAAIASTAASVLDQSPQPDLRAAAIDKIGQALLRRLSNANTLTCAMVLPVTKAKYTPPLPAGVTPPRLFGQPQGELAAQTPSDARDPNDNFALSTAKIPLSTTTDASTLAFLVTSRAADQQAYVQLVLDYALSHIEHDIHGVPGIENYEQSSWITFLTGPYLNPIVPPSGDSFAIPVALRALPTPATVVAQTGTGTLTDATGFGNARAAGTPADLKSWRYTFSYLLNQAAQDSVIAQVEFNHPATASAKLATTPEDTLYANLAQFVAIYPAVARDLESYLRPINAKSEAGTPDVLNAEYAVAALETVVAGVASAYEAWAKTHALAQAVVAPPPQVVYRFEIILEPGESAEAVVEIKPISFEQNGAPVTNFLPLAKVLIDPDNYDPEPIPPVPQGGAVRYRYVLRPSPQDPTLPPVMPYETARLNAARAVEFGPLDLFALQNGWASVQVMRNAHLSPDNNVATNPVFEFVTAEARFADPLVPLIDYASYPIDQGPSAQPINAWLTAFFASLLAPTDGVAFTEPVLVKLETSYSYQLASNIPPTQLPLSLLPPTTTDGATDPPFIASVSSIAQQWFDTDKPVNTPTSASAFNFGLAVFTASGRSDMPLLRIGALTLAAPKVATS